MFEEVSQKVNINREFHATMMAGKRFPETNINEFIETMATAIRGQQGGNNFRNGSG